MSLPTYTLGPPAAHARSSRRGRTIPLLQTTMGKPRPRDFLCSIGNGNGRIGDIFQCPATIHGGHRGSHRAGCGRDAVIQFFQIEGCGGTIVVGGGVECFVSAYASPGGE